MKIKQRPEDFVVREGSSFEAEREGPVWVYRMDKQKISTLQALERIGKEFGVRRRALSICGLKDKQGRTEQLVGVEGGALGTKEVVQSGDLRLQLIGRAKAPLTSANVTANRFEVTVRDLTREEAERVPESAKEVERAGLVNYFDSQRFGFLKHGQGFIGKQLIRGDFEGALKSYLATPSKLDRSDDAKVKEFWRDNWGDWRKFAPQKAGAIYAPMLRVLRSNPEDFKGAFMHIERRSRMMTLFELQSDLWNEGVRRYLISILPPAELIGLRYQAGALVFPRAIPQALRAELATKTFPLLSSESTFTDPLIEKAAIAALQSQGIALSQMKVPDAPQLFFKHEERPLFIHPGKLRVSEARPDDMNGGRLKITLSFTLPPGAYATLVVRRVLWFASEGFRELDPEGSAAARASKARARAFERELDAAEGASKPRWGRPAADFEDAKVAALGSDLRRILEGGDGAGVAKAAKVKPAKAARAEPPPPKYLGDAARGKPRQERRTEIPADSTRAAAAPASAPAPEHIDPRSNGFLARQKAKKAAREARKLEDAAKAKRR